MSSSQPRFDLGSHELKTFDQLFHLIKKYSTSWHK